MLLIGLNPSTDSERYSTSVTKKKNKKKNNQQSSDNTVTCSLQYVKNKIKKYIKIWCLFCEFKLAQLRSAQLHLERGGERAKLVSLFSSRGRKSNQAGRTRRTRRRRKPSRRRRGQIALWRVVTQSTTQRRSPVGSIFFPSRQSLRDRHLLSSPVIRNVSREQDSRL